MTNLVQRAPNGQHIVHAQKHVEISQSAAQQTRKTHAVSQEHQTDGMLLGKDRATAAVAQSRRGRQEQINTHKVQFSIPQTDVLKQTAKQCQTRTYT
jgi:hypothetical protein